jgi:hypothetical protein
VKIPKKLLCGKKSVKFRETWRMSLGYKLINFVTLNTVIDVRVFWPSRGSTCKAVIWVNSHARNGGYGVGIAGGYGYHHESAAIQNAFNDMGIIFEGEEWFFAVGEGAQEDAIKAVGKALGYNNVLLVKFNP